MIIGNLLFLPHPVILDALFRILGDHMEAPTEAPVQPVAINPMTFRELKATRLQFLGFFLGLGAVSVCASGFSRMLFDPTGDPIRSPLPLAVVLTSILVPILLYAGLVAIYARRVGMPRWWL